MPSMEPENVMHSTFGGRQITAWFNVYWMATFADYDGAPDASPAAKLMGTGRTEAEAVDHLIEQAEECAS